MQYWTKSRLHPRVSVLYVLSAGFSYSSKTFDTLGSFSLLTFSSLMSLGRFRIPLVLWRIFHLQDFYYDGCKEGKQPLSGSWQTECVLDCSTWKWTHSYFVWNFQSDLIIVSAQFNPSPDLPFKIKLCSLTAPSCGTNSYYTHSTVQPFFSFCRYLFRTIHSRCFWQLNS